MEPNDKRSENIIPYKFKKGDISSEEAAQRGRNGGKKSGKVRREKVLMSEIYAEFLAEEHDIEIDKKTRLKISGKNLVKYTMEKIMAKNESHSVSLIKELREGTEGSKAQLTGANGKDLIPNKITIEFIDVEPQA